MTSSKFSQKRTVKSYFEEISAFDLFYQLTYMTATSAAGVSRARVFQLARDLACPIAKYFKSIHQVAENLRYNYPDAVRLVGEQTPSEHTRNFLLRLSDALRSGEPLAAFLKRETEVQGENYANDYGRAIESMKKWTDAYASVNVSAALIVVINMVMLMIYNLGTGLMAMMVLVAVSANFGVAWVLFRAAPPETKNVPLAEGSKDQRLAKKLLLISLPLTIVACFALWWVGLPNGWVMVVAGIGLGPVGFVANKFDGKTSGKDSEISSFLRSLGGTATSRGTTLKDALANMKIDSFPALQQDIHKLDLRLKAFLAPKFCWTLFGRETGSKLADQATGIFFEAINLGGDPERAGNLTSAFALKTAMLRAQRRGVAATFSWLTLTMHTILTAMMVFLLGILEQFAVRLNTAMTSLGGDAQSISAMGLKNMFVFDTAQAQYLTMITIGMVLTLAVVNAFAIVASEGGHLLKMTFYLCILLILSGLCFIVVPPLVKTVM